MVMLFVWKLMDYKSTYLPAHAHRHERHCKVVVCQMK